MPSTLQRFVLWDYPRASWQYDVMVGVILIFVMLTPRDWFRDQPRIPYSNEIALLPAAHGSNVFWIEPELVSSFPENQWLAQVSDVLRKKTGKQLAVTRLDPIYDSENEVKGYMAFTKP